MTQSGTARREELRAGLRGVRQRLESACDRAGRDASEVTLVVVTKFFPATDVRLLHELEVQHVGESRHQEGQEKHEQCADLGDLTWHFVGQLQRNKAAAVAEWADVVHSVDRARLLAPLAKGAGTAGLDVLVQVNLDPPDASGGSRGGAPPADVVTLATEVGDLSGLRLRGVMGIAPLDGDPAPAFARLAQLATQVREVEPEARWISAGMSGDLEAAVEAGATHVRVGSAILGNRPSGL